MINCTKLLINFLGEFGSLEWSPDESKLIYIAEKKSVKSEAYYKRKRKSEDNDTIQVSKFCKYQIQIF